MGFTYIKLRVCNPTNWERQSEVELLVDTGAVMSVIPSRILEALEIKAVGKRRFRTFGGKLIKRGVGTALFRYADAFGGVPIAFGEEGDTPILGATALETLGYQVDPVSKQLKPVELLLL